MRHRINENVYDGAYIGRESSRVNVDLIERVEEGFGQWVTAAFQLTRRLWDRHTLVAGLEYRDNPASPRAKPGTASACTAARWRPGA